MALCEPTRLEKYQIQPALGQVIQQHDATKEAKDLHHRRLLH